MLPASLALVDDDQEFTEFLAQDLRSRGIEVAVFANSSDLLASPECFRFEFYVLDLSLPGVDGLEVIRILRKRTHAGILVISGRLGANVFSEVVDAGADMYFAKPVNFQQVALGIMAVQRRSAVAIGAVAEWRLDCHASELITPDGVTVPLSEGDLAVLECFMHAQGKPVPREAIRERLQLEPSTTSHNALHATVYRLRRRIERATPIMVPLQSQQGVGYVFKGTLLAA